MGIIGSEEGRNEPIADKEAAREQREYLQKEANQLGE
jgi:hypothetical protein